MGVEEKLEFCYCTVLATLLLPLVSVSLGAQEAGMDGRHQGRVPPFFTPTH